MDFKQRFIVLDIETTGITFEYFDEPTEIALIEIIDGKITGEKKHFYLKPNKTVTKNFLSKIFGKDLVKKVKSKDFKLAKEIINKYISKNDYTVFSKEELLELKEEADKVDLMVNNMYENINKGQNKYKILPLIRDFIGDSYVVAHNANFDITFLNYWFNALKLPLLNKYICTFVNYKKHFNFKENNLTACCNYYGITLDGAHNALEDTTACAELFLKEINDFPNEIETNNLKDFESYAKFKKRVLATNYCCFANTILNESVYMKNLEEIGDLEQISCKNLFFNFKKPIEVSKITGFDLGSVETIFVDWVNCININKHLDLIRDKYLYETIREMLKYCNNNFELINVCNNLIFGKDANLFYFKLVDKLENKKDLMEYSLSDFEFYFANLKNLEDLSNKINKSNEYIYSFLLDWTSNNTNLLKYRDFIRNKLIKKDDEFCKAFNKHPNKKYFIKVLGINNF